MGIDIKKDFDKQVNYVNVFGVIKLDERPPPPVEATAQGLSLGALTPELLDQAQEIAGEAHTYNHFECDPLIATFEARRLFQEQVALHLKSSRSQGFGAVGEGHEGAEALFGFIIANRVESFIPFGTAQKPNLWDYADQVDTLVFLSDLN